MVGQYREAALDDLAHQAQTLSHFQGGHRKTAEKYGQWTEILTRNSNGRKGTGKPRREMIILITIAPCIWDGCARSNASAWD